MHLNFCTIVLQLIFGVFGYPTGMLCEVHKHRVFALLFLADASPQCAAWFHYGCR